MEKEPSNQRSGYSGFLIIRCEVCGKDRGFYVKNPIQKFECVCGHKTAIGNLAPVYMNCECGRFFKYRTNHEEAHFTVKCPNCESHVEVELNKDRTAYVTMSDTKPIRRKRK